ncbi:MAG: Uma2 family endonuclease [Byssovorax sp.]
MGEPAPTPYISHADYLALEEKSATKHEWLEGLIYDMSGGTPDHAGLAAAVVVALGTQLRGKRCRVYTADLKVRVLATGLSTYADVAVVCGSLDVDPADKNAVTNPALLVEVLSDSTEAYDRGEKFGHYRRISSLAEYVLVSQHSPKIEVFRKNEAGKWVLAEEASPGEVAPLLSIGCALSVDEIYADPLREHA